ncbi:DUF3048 domain-containing protein [soil metagenome]
MLLLVVLLAACGGGDDGGDNAAPVEQEEPVLCPLTGVEAPSGVNIDRPALAVKVDNAPPARPQAGIEAADIVYEEISEGGLTRFLTVFHCNDAGDIGPVRSARTVDPDILQEFGTALFGYSGANSQVLDKIAGSDFIADLKHGSNADAYTRDSDRKAPYNLMTSTQDLRSAEDAEGIQGSPQTGLVFNAEFLNPAAPASPAAGETASPAAPAGNSVSFSYSNSNVVRYDYDAANSRYLRFNGEVAHSLSNGQQVGAVNVVVQKVKIVPGTVRDASGSPTQDTTVVGSGEATVLRGGRAVTGTWSRPSLNDNTTFTDGSGETIEFAPGNTFIHLVPQERPVTVQ